VEEFGVPLSVGKAIADDGLGEFGASEIGEFLAGRRYASGWTLLVKIFESAEKARVRRSLRAHDRLRFTPAISRAAIVVYTCESGDHQSNDRLTPCVLVRRSGTRGNVAKWQSDQLSTA